MSAKRASTGVPAALAAACLAGLAGSGCSGGDSSLPANGRPVILVSIDSLRADHCSLYGYRPRFAPDLATTPFLERLAAEGVVFDQAVSPTSWTLPAHISLLTGLGCVEHGVHDRNVRLAPEVETLAERLQRSGYATAGFFSGPLLHPAWGFGRGFDRYAGVVDYALPLDAIADERGAAMRQLYEESHDDARCAERVVDAALEWLESGERFREPFFLFLHLWDPHYDYAPPPALAAQFDPGYEGPVSGRGFMARGARWRGRDLEHWIALYDAEIRYTDQELARFWQRIEAWGIAEEVVLVVTADHGEEFYEHGRKGHNKTLFEEVVRVPMLLRATGLAPKAMRIPQQVGLVDVLPTLLDLCDAPIPAGLTGSSMRPLWQGASGQRRPLVLDLHAPAFDSVLRGWRTEGSKVVWDLRDGAGLRFDLHADPQERQGQRVPSLEDASVAGFRAALREAEAAARRPRPMVPPAALQAELERLGYVGGDARDD